MYINAQNLLPVTVNGVPTITNWLNYKEPLTDRLFNSTGSADLVLLQQGWQELGWWARHILSCDERPVFQREIVMQSHGKVFWYARTLIPEACYQLQPAFFARLQHETLRQLIYDNPEVVRVNMVHYAIDNRCLEYYWVKKYVPYCAPILWVRLSELLFMHDKSFYLVEILMPDLEQIA